MSYVALATDDFDRAVHFYREELGFPTVSHWDRSTGRGCRLDVGGGVRLEILDNARQRCPAELGTPDGRVHLVVEVVDIEQARRSLRVDTPPVQPTSWGAHLFQLEGPDGVRITFLQWANAEEQR